MTTCPPLDSHLMSSHTLSRVVIPRGRPPNNHDSRILLHGARGGGVSMTTPVEYPGPQTVDDKASSRAQSDRIPPVGGCLLTKHVRTIPAAAGQDSRRCSKHLPQSRPNFRERRNENSPDICAARRNEASSYSSRLRWVAIVNRLLNIIDHPDSVYIFRDERVCNAYSG